MGNQINVIRPYWSHKGSLVFDDPAVGLTQEPFVAGADSVLAELASRVSSKCQKEFVLYFSHEPFPGHQTVIRRVREESGGNWYVCDDLGGREGWLCPALYRYYDVAPDFLYLQIKEPQA